MHPVGSRKARRFHQLRFTAPALAFAIGCGTGQQELPRTAPPKAEHRPALKAAALPAESPSPDAVPWSAYDLEIGCADALGPPLDPPFLVVTDEDEYLRYFCAASKIDWKKFRLVVYSESGNGEDELFVDDVTRSGSELVVLLSRARQCGERNLSYAVGYVAILVPAGSEHVRRLHGASSCR